jgi:hypothetical protein
MPFAAPKACGHPGCPTLNDPRAGRHNPRSRYCEKHVGDPFKTVADYEREKDREASAGPEGDRGSALTGGIRLETDRPQRACVWRNWGL